MANTSGSTRTGPTTSACWATRRSPIPIEWASSKIPGYAIRASMPNFHGFTAFVVMSSVAARFFAPQVSGIGATPTSVGAASVFRIDHDENFNSDHSPAISDREERTVDRLQLALRQRPGGRSGAVRGRQLRQRAERDRFDRGRFRPDAGSAVRGGTVLRQRARHADHSDQPDRPVPRVAVRLNAAADSRAGNRGRRPQSAAHRVAQSVRHRPSDTTTCFTATGTSGAPGCRWST